MALGQLRRLGAPGRDLLLKRRAAHLQILHHRANGVRLLGHLLALGHPRRDLFLARLQIRVALRLARQRRLGVRQPVGIATRRRQRRFDLLLPGDLGREFIHPRLRLGNFL